MKIIATQNIKIAVTHLNRSEVFKTKKVLHELVIFLIKRGAPPAIFLSPRSQTINRFKEGNNTFEVKNCKYKRL